MMRPHVLNIWVHKQVLNKMGERCSPTVGICAVFVFSTKCPRKQIITLADKMSVSKLAQDTNITALLASSAS